MKALPPPLTKPVITAAERIFSRAYSQTLDFTKLRSLVQANPVAIWDEFATFHVEERVEWCDGTPDSVSFCATLSGCEIAQIKGAAMLLLLRGEAERHNRSPHAKVKNHYRLLMAVRNNINGLHGWLDCETGKLQTGKGWPHLIEALQNKPADKSVRAPVEAAA